jgi:hypothetical protein
MSFGYFRLSPSGGLLDIIRCFEVKTRCLRGILAVCLDFWSGQIHVEIKKIGFSHIYTAYRENRDKTPLYVVLEESELFQHVVDHYSLP